MTGRQLDISQAQRNYDAAVSMYGEDHPETVRYLTILNRLLEG